jgi:hypothetical protein
LGKQAGDSFWLFSGWQQFSGFFSPSGAQTPALPTFKKILYFVMQD